MDCVRVTNNSSLDCYRSSSGLMAWGYWTAHSLTARACRPRSLSPAPGLATRDHSADRPNIETECGAINSQVGPSYHTDHHQHTIEWEDRLEDRNRRTKLRDRDRNTLPRVKMDTDLPVVGVGGGGTVMVEQRHTLPRGRTDPESGGWPDSASLPQSGGKASSEGDWCPGCQSCPVSNVSSCRVSFHSVKDSSSAGQQTATSSDHDPAEREVVSSSLPSPPPPPAQVGGDRSGGHSTSLVQKSTNWRAAPSSGPDPASSPHLHQGGQGGQREGREDKHKPVRRSGSARQMEERDVQTEPSQARKHGVGGSPQNMSIAENSTRVCRIGYFLSLFFLYLNYISSLRRIF